MRVMVLVRATTASEAGEMPSTELLAAMGQFNEQLIEAGVMLDGAGLKPSSLGKRVVFRGDEREAYDGPFDIAGVVAGYWVWRVKDMTEAVAWAKRCPNPMPTESELELRPLYEEADFA